MTLKFSRHWNSQFLSNSSGLGFFDLCLEIGCFEGLTSVHIATSMLNDDGKLICVDPLTDQYLNENLTATDKSNLETQWKFFEGQYDRFINNTADLLESKKVELIRKSSAEAYPFLIEKYKEQVEFIYIDGDHRADPVYVDAINCFKLCKTGGYILFDDYLWDVGDGNAPRIGIDRFLGEHDGSYKLLKQNHQLLIQKL